jgi:hypothetical protein
MIGFPSAAMRSAIYRDTTRAVRRPKRHDQLDRLTGRTPSRTAAAAQNTENAATL